MRTLRLTSAASLPSTTTREGARDSSAALFGLTLLVLGLAFFVNGHALDHSQTEGSDYTLSGTEAARSVAEGSSLRRVDYLGIGLFGLALLARGRGQPLNFSDPLAALMLVYIAWCAASVVWSPAPVLTVRRVVILLCCIVAMLGVARQLPRQSLLWLAFSLSLAFVTAGFLAEVTLGTFRPWTSGYRYAGTVHPNSAGQLCALICLSAYALVQTPRRINWLLWLAFAFGLALAVLSKSRTSCLCMLVGLTALWLPRARASKVGLLGVTGPLLISTACLIAACNGGDVFDRVTNTVTLGRANSIGSVSGRLPLWTELIGHAAARPLLGHGYLSFWTADRIQEVSTTLRWTIPDAHNEYLDVLLNVGLIGWLLLAACVSLATLRAAAIFWRGGDPSYGFFFAFFLFSLTGAWFESGFAQPLGLSPFVAACCMAHLGFCPPQTPRRARPRLRSHA